MGVIIHPDVGHKILRPIVKELGKYNLRFSSYIRKTVFFSYFQAKKTWEALEGTFIGDFFQLQNFFNILVIEGISAQSPQSRIYGDIFILCEVVEENYYIKKGEKKVASKFWKKNIKFQNGHIQATRKYYCHIFCPSISWRTSQIGLLNTNWEQCVRTNPAFFL